MSANTAHHGCRSDALLDELLSTGLLTLSGSTGLDDIGRRFLTILQRHCPATRIDLFSRLPGQSAWTTVADSGPQPEVPFPGRADDIKGGVEIGPEGNLLRGMIRLHDGAAVGVVVSLLDRGCTFGETDASALRVAFTIVDAAYQIVQRRQHEKDLVFTLNQRLLQLNSLIDTGIDIATLDADVSPWSLALERAVALTNASKGCVTLSRNGAIQERLWFPPGWEKEDPAMTDGITAEFDFEGVRYVFTLGEKESRRGVVPFDGTDHLLLDALSRQVHAALENRFLMKQSLDKQRMEQDLAVAASIQQKILPDKLPEIPGYDAAGINIPSRSVGGDYYDCIPLSDGKVALVIADVAGKGIPAALLVSSLHAYLSVYLESGRPLVDIVRRLNTMIHRASTDDKFITAFVAVLDPATGSLESVNAGHNAVYLHTGQGTVTELSVGGIPLGMLDMDLPYESERHVLQPGARLFLYTDGIPEAQNGAHQLYESVAPLQEFFRAFCPENAREFIEKLIADVQRFTGDAPQADDITALYLVRC